MRRQACTSQQCGFRYSTLETPIEDFWESDPAKTETHQREGLPTRDGKAAGKTRVNPSLIGNPHAVRLKVMCNNCNHIFEFKHDCCPKCGAGSMSSTHTRTSRKMPYKTIGKEIPRVYGVVAIAACVVMLILAWSLAQ